MIETVDQSSVAHRQVLALGSREQEWHRDQRH
jgi:hypothetical protein